MANIGKQLSRIMDDLERQGAKIITTKSGYQIRCPSGATVTTHITPSDHRALKNFRGDIRRAGLTWPEDKK